MTHTHFYMLLLISISLSAQHTLTGVVKDSTHTQGIPFANVILTTTSNEMVTGTITDDAGAFTLTAKPGAYQLTVSFLGYEEYRQSIALQEDLDIGVLSLTKDQNELETVVVTAAKPTIEKKVDRLVFNVENAVGAVGDAMDILQKTPGVRVSADDIGLIGKSSVRILINDRLSTLRGEDLSAYLRSLSAEDIARIEVITNPPAQYEAEGNSGLINIVLKKIQRDFWGGNIRTTYQQTTYPGLFVGGGTTYQKGRWSLFGNLNTGNASQQVTETNTISYEQQTWDTESRIRYFNRFVGGRAGVDYDLSDRTSLGVQYLGATKRPDNEEATNTQLLGTAQALDSILRTTGASDKKTYYHALNGHFKTQLDTVGTTLSADVDYFVYRNDLERNSETQTLLAEGTAIPDAAVLLRNTSLQDIETFTSGIDVVWPTDWARLELGAKLGVIQNTSDVRAYTFQEGVYTLSNELSNIFEYEEQTQAVYASGSKSVGKWDFKLGLRMEFTQTKGNSITLNQVNTNDYYKLFPTVYTTYTPNDNTSWSFNYGKRINRPGYSDLNPFRWYDNPYSYTEGNPFLQPSFTDNLELSHLHKNNLSSSAYVSYTEQGSEQVTLTDATSNIQATVRRNFLETVSVGFFQSYTFKKINWLESYWQYDINYSEIQSSLPGTIGRQQGFNMYVAVDNTLFFNAKKTFSGELGAWYAAPGVNGVDTMEARYAANAGLKWLLFDKQWQLNLVARDIFRTNETIFNTTINNIPQRYQNYYDNQRFWISVVYRFGNRDLKSKSKQFSNEEERKRTD